MPISLTAEIDFEDVERLWRQHNGDKIAARGEVPASYHMSEKNFWEFMKETLQLQSNRQEWDQAELEMCKTWAIREYGPRP